MLDESSNNRLPSEHTSNEIGCLNNEEYSMNNVEDYCEEYHDQYWLEMFLHALKDDDQHAQKWFQQKFSPILLDWIYGHPKSDLACRLHDEEYYIIETFRCFWYSLREQQKFDVTSMADVLSYLHISMNGVILDTLRNYSRPQEAPLTSTWMAGEAQSNENGNSHEIWGLIEEKLSSEREQRMAYLLFQCALKPGEIVGSFPNEFSDVNEISHIRRDIMELLSR